MKKNLCVVFCIGMALCLGFGQAASAAEKFGIGANVSYMGVADAGPDDVINFDGVSLIGLNATAYINSFISLSFDLGYSQLDVDASSVSAGDLEQIPLLATARLHLPFFESISPYVGAGIGYYFNEFNTSDFLSLAGGEVTADDNFAVHLNGGVELFVGEHLALNLDLKYLWNEADLTNPGGLPVNDLDMRTFIAGVGVKFYF